MKGKLVLLAAAVFVLLVWTVLLPWIGRGALRESIDRRAALGVNADAMFYTELEAMETLQVTLRSE